MFSSVGHRVFPISVSKSARECGRVAARPSPGSGPLPASYRLSDVGHRVGESSPWPAYPLPPLTAAFAHCTTSHGGYATTLAEVRSTDSGPGMSSETTVDRFVSCTGCPRFFLNVAFGHSQTGNPKSQYRKTKQIRNPKTQKPKNPKTRKPEKISAAAKVTVMGHKQLLTIGHAASSEIQMSHLPIRPCAYPATVFTTNPVGSSRAGGLA